MWGRPPCDAGRMANFLEQLVVEFYEYQGYFVRQNVMVGKRAKGGYEGELDVVAFHPVKKHLVHIEPSMDAHNWEKREERFTKKFAAGRRYIPELFTGLDIPKDVEQIALFGFGGRGGRSTIGGGNVELVSEFMKRVAAALPQASIARAAVPEGFPLLRTMQFTLQHVVER